MDEIIFGPPVNVPSGRNTTWSRATSRKWIYTRAPVRAGNMADRCANMAATRILYLHEEAVLRKTPSYKSNGCDCSAEAICKSS